MPPMREKDNMPESVATTTEMEAQGGPEQNMERDQKIQCRDLEGDQEAGHDLDDWLQAEREMDTESV